MSDYRIFHCAYKIDLTGIYKGSPVYKQRLPLTREKGVQLLRVLQNRHIIRKDPNFKSGIFRINEIGDRSADEVCALADPFCYVSHLSAMHRYGLTSRIPARLYITTPERTLWNRLRDAMMRRDYGDDLHIHDIIPLQQYGFLPKIRRLETIRHESKFVAKTVEIKGSFTRISAIGDTFVEMLNNPNLCGGMAHVLEVWQQHAHTYLDDIITAVGRCPIEIAKVRAGYILDEYMQTQDTRISAWLDFAQRGGSRLLDPEGSYQPKFSEKWMISLNV